MGVMSSHLVRRIVLGGLLFAGLLSARFAVAGATTLESMLENGLLPSSVPALLAPISESGRTGWACAPERAAAATRAGAAELPASTDSH